MKVLLTGFDPFDGEKVNPALEAVKMVPDKVENIEVVKLEVPTVFGEAVKKVTQKIDEISPDVVICVGQAGGRAKVTVERVAINCMDAGIADNAGVIPADEPVLADGPAAYFTTIDIKKIIAAINAEGIPAAVSNTAGTFVCNSLIYGVLNHIEKNGKDIKAGFIHVPFTTVQTVDKSSGMPSMSLENITQALTCAVRNCV